jgi:hypothetical protein
VHPDFETLSTAAVDQPDAHGIRVFDDALDQVLQRGPERRVSFRRWHRH